MKSLFHIAVFSFALFSCSAFKVRGPAQIQKPRHVIITVHGLSGNEKTWGQVDIVKNYLEKINPKYEVEISNFVYPTGQSEKLTTFDFADLLDQHIQGLFKDRPISAEDKISLVAHSQGGLVSYIWFFTHIAEETAEQKYIQHVDSIITLGTPFWGSKLASILTDKNVPDIVPLVNLFGGDEFQLSRRELLDMAYSSDTINKFREFAVKTDMDPKVLERVEKLPVRLINIIGLLPKDQKDVYANKDLKNVSDLTKKIVHYIYKIFKDSESDIAVGVPSGRWNFIYTPTHEITKNTYIKESEFKHFSHLLNRSKFLFTESVHLPFEGDSTLSMAYINKSCEVVEDCNHPTLRYVLEHLANCKKETCDQNQFENIVQRMKIVNKEQHDLNKKISTSLKTFTIQLSIKLPPGQLDKFPVRFFHQKPTGDDSIPVYELYEPYLIGEVMNLHSDKYQVSYVSSPERKIWIGRKNERRSVDIFTRVSKSASDEDVIRFHLSGYVEEKDNLYTEDFKVPLTLRLPGYPEVKLDAKVHPSYSTYINLDYSKYSK